MAKIVERIQFYDGFGHSKKEHLAAIARLRDGFGEPGAAAAKRIPGAENRILKARTNFRLRLSDFEKPTLAKIAKRLGRKALPDIALAPGLVSEADGAEVQWLQTARIRWEPVWSRNSCDP
jgi:hypothetical protein